MVNKFRITLMLFIFLFNIAEATNLCQEQNLGWHFYCDPTKNKVDDEQNISQTDKATKQLYEVKQKLQDLKVTALFYPTPENAIKYIEYQNEQVERAEKFARVWKQVTWQNPNLDYSVKRPINTVGNALNEHVLKERISKVKQSIGARYGLFFFYNNNCIYCQKFSPILKSFADFNNIKVMAISMSNEFLPEWPLSTINRGEAEKFGLSDKPVPALMLFDSVSKKIISIGYGLLTMDELEFRLYTLVTANEEGENE